MLVGGSDYQEINAETLDIILTFDNNNRRQSFTVDISDDQFLEDAENFMMELRFDPSEEPPSNLTLSPNIATVYIIDDDGIILILTSY